MYVFLIIYFVVIISFAFTFYVLSYNLGDLQDGEDKIQGNLLRAILYSYRMGFGELESDFYEESNERVLWYFLLLC